MQYTLKRLIDKHPELCEQLKAKCYAINGACAAVHRELGPFLNEYMYQEALQILLDEQQIPNQREYYFQVVFHGKPIQHKHFVDFLVENDIIVVDAITTGEYKTKKIAAMLKAIEADKKALIVLPEVDSMVIKSANNIPGVKTAQVNTINVYDILNADKLIIAKDAVSKIEEVYA